MATGARYKVHAKDLDDCSEVTQQAKEKLRVARDDQLVQILTEWPAWKETDEALNLRFWMEEIGLLESALISVMNQIGQQQFIYVLPSQCLNPHLFSSPLESLVTILKFLGDLFGRVVGKEVCDLPMQWVGICLGSLNDSVANAALEVYYQLSRSVYQHRHIYVHDRASPLSMHLSLSYPLFDIIAALHCLNRVRPSQFINKMSDADGENEHLFLETVFDYSSDWIFSWDTNGLFAPASWVFENDPYDQIVHSLSLSRKEAWGVDLSQYQDSAFSMMRQCDITGLSLRQVVQSTSSWGLKAHLKMGVLWRARMLRHQSILNKSGNPLEKFFDVTRWLFWAASTVISIHFLRTGQDIMPAYVDSFFAGKEQLGEDVVFLLDATSLKVNHNLFGGNPVDCTVKKRLFSENPSSNHIVDGSLNVPSDVRQVVTSFLCSVLIRPDYDRNLFQGFRTLQCKLGLMRFDAAGELADTSDAKICLLANLLRDQLGRLTELLQSFDTVLPSALPINFDSSEYPSLFFTRSQYVLFLQWIESLAMIISSGHRIRGAYKIWKRENLLELVVLFLKQVLLSRSSISASSAVSPRISNMTLNDCLDCYSFRNMECALIRIVEELISKSESSSKLFITVFGGGAITLKRLHFELTSISTPPLTPPKSICMSFKTLILSYLSVLGLVAEMYVVTGPFDPPLENLSVQHWWQLADRKLGSVGTSPSVDAFNSETLAIDTLSGNSIAFLPQFIFVMRTILTTFAPHYSPLFASSVSFIQELVSNDPKPHSVLLHFLQQDVYTPLFNAALGPGLDHDEDTVNSFLGFLDQACMDHNCLNNLVMSGFNPFQLSFSLMTNPHYADQEYLQLFSNMPTSIGRELLSLIRHHPMMIPRCLEAMSSTLTSLLANFGCQKQEFLDSGYSHDFQVFEANSGFSLNHPKYSPHSFAFAVMICFTSLLGKSTALDAAFEILGTQGLIELLKSTCSPPSYLLTSLAGLTRDRIQGYPPFMQGYYRVMEKCFHKRQKILLSTVLKNLRNQFMWTVGSVTAFRKKWKPVCSDGELGANFDPMSIQGIISRAPNYSDNIDHTTQPNSEVASRTQHYFEYAELLGSVTIMAHLLEVACDTIGDDGRYCVRHVDDLFPNEESTTSSVPELLPLIQMLSGPFLKDCLTELTMHVVPHEHDIVPEEYYVYTLLILSSEVSIVQDLESMLPCVTMCAQVGCTVEVTLKVTLHSAVSKSKHTYFRSLYNKNMWIGLSFATSGEEQAEVLGIRKCTPEEVLLFGIQESWECLVQESHLCAVNSFDEKKLRDYCGIELEKVSMQNCGFSAFQFLCCSVSNFLGSIIVSLNNEQVVKRKCFKSLIPNVLESLCWLRPQTTELSFDGFNKAYNLVNICFWGILEQSRYALLLAHVTLSCGGKFLDSILACCNYMILCCAADSSHGNDMSLLRRYASCRVREAFDLYFALRRACDVENRHKSNATEQMLKGLNPNFNGDGIREVMALKINCSVSDLMLRINPSSLHWTVGEQILRLAECAQAACYGMVSNAQRQLIAVLKEPERKSSNSSEIAFISSLEEGLRMEVLSGLDRSALLRLSPEIIAEAASLNNGSAIQIQLEQGSAGGNVLPSPSGHDDASDGDWEDASDDDEHENEWSDASDRDADGSNSAEQNDPHAETISANIPKATVRTDLTIDDSIPTFEASTVPRVMIEDNIDAINKCRIAAVSFVSEMIAGGVPGVSAKCSVNVRNRIKTGLTWSDDHEMQSFDHYETANSVECHLSRLIRLLFKCCNKYINTDTDRVIAALGLSESKDFVLTVLTDQEAQFLVAAMLLVSLKYRAINILKDLDRDMTQLELGMSGTAENIIVADRKLHTTLTAISYIFTSSRHVFSLQLSESYLICCLTLLCTAHRDLCCFYSLLQQVMLRRLNLVQDRVPILSNIWLYPAVLVADMLSRPISLSALDSNQKHARFFDQVVKHTIIDDLCSNSEQCFEEIMRKFRCHLITLESMVDSSYKAVCQPAVVFEETSCLLISRIIELASSGAFSDETECSRLAFGAGRELHISQVLLQASSQYLLTIIQTFKVSATGQPALETAIQDLIQLKNGFPGISTIAAEVILAASENESITFSKLEDSLIVSFNRLPNFAGKWSSTSQFDDKAISLYSAMYSKHPHQFISALFHSSKVMCSFTKSYDHIATPTSKARCEVNAMVVSVVAAKIKQVVGDFGDLLGLIPVVDRKQNLAIHIGEGFLLLARLLPHVDEVTLFLVLKSMIFNPGVIRNMHKSDSATIVETFEFEASSVATGEHSSFAQFVIRHVLWRNLLGDHADCCSESETVGVEFLKTCAMDFVLVLLSLSSDDNTTIGNSIRKEDFDRQLLDIFVLELKRISTMVAATNSLWNMFYCGCTIIRLAMSKIRLTMNNNAFDHLAVPVKKALAYLLTQDMHHGLIQSLCYCRANIEFPAAHRAMLALASAIDILVRIGFPQYLALTGCESDEDSLRSYEQLFSIELLPVFDWKKKVSIRESKVSGSMKSASEANDAENSLEKIEETTKSAIQSGEIATVLPLNNDLEFPSFHVTRAEEISLQNVSNQYDYGFEHIFQGLNDEETDDGDAAHHDEDGDEEGSDDDEDEVDEDEDIENDEEDEESHDEYDDEDEEESDGASMTNEQSSEISDEQMKTLLLNQPLSRSIDNDGLNNTWSVGFTSDQSQLRVMGQFSFRIFVDVDNLEMRHLKVSDILSLRQANMIAGDIGASNMDHWSALRFGCLGEISNQVFGDIVRDLFKVRLENMNNTSALSVTQALGDTMPESEMLAPLQMLHELQILDNVGTLDNPGSFQRYSLDDLTEHLSEGLIAFQESLRNRLQAVHQFKYVQLFIRSLGFARIVSREAVSGAPVFGCLYGLLLKLLSSEHSGNSAVALYPSVFALLNGFSDIFAFLNKPSCIFLLSSHNEKSCSMLSLCIELLGHSFFVNNREYLIDLVEFLLSSCERMITQCKQSFELREALSASGILPLLPEVSDEAIGCILATLFGPHGEHASIRYNMTQLLAFLSHQYLHWKRIMARIRAAVVRELNAAESIAADYSNARDVLSQLNDVGFFGRLLGLMRVAAQCTEVAKTAQSELASAKLQSIPSDFPSVDQEIADIYARVVAPIAVTTLSAIVLGEFEQVATGRRGAAASPARAAISSNDTVVADHRVYLPFLECYISAVCICVTKGIDTSSSTSLAGETLITSKGEQLQSSIPVRVDSVQADTSTPYFVGSLGNTPVAPTLSPTEDSNEEAIESQLVASPTLPMKREFSMPGSRFKSTTMRKLSQITTRLNANVNIFDLAEGDGYHVTILSPVAGSEVSAKCGEDEYSLQSPMINSAEDMLPITKLIKFAASGKDAVNAMLKDRIQLLDKTLILLHILPECRQNLDFAVKRKFFEYKIEDMKRRLVKKAHDRSDKLNLAHLSVVPLGFTQPSTGASETEPRNSVRGRNHDGDFDVLENSDDDDNSDDEGYEGYSIGLDINRSSIAADTYQQMRDVSVRQLVLNKFDISFGEEGGIDAGGLTREWLLLFMREMFKPQLALFTQSSDGVTFQPNPNSGANPEHLELFKLIGRIIGKALMEGFLLDVHFTRPFYKHMLGMQVNFHDVESVDPDYFKSLNMILNFSLEDLGMQGSLTFSAEQHNFGKIEIVDLIPNGKNILVTDENKQDYVQYIAYHRLTAAFRCQIDAFLDGFHQCIPADAISVFDPLELELLISGCPDIDFEDLRRNTDYTGYQPSDPTIIALWRLLNEFSKEEKALFIQFVTGSSKVPLEGFKSLQGNEGPQKFSVHKSFVDIHQLPTAHTCFNQLDLPNYEDYDLLKAKLLLAIRECSEGFGFA